MSSSLSSSVRGNLRLVALPVTIGRPGGRIFHAMLSTRPPGLKYGRFGCVTPIGTSSKRSIGVSRIYASNSAFRPPRFWRSEPRGCLRLKGRG